MSYVRIFVEATSGNTAASKIWQDLMSDLLVLCFDYHQNVKEIFGLVPVNRNLDNMKDLAKSAIFKELSEQQAFHVLMLGSSDMNDVEKTSA